MLFTPQTDRIRKKLAVARQSDPQLKVFGARDHQYALGTPADEGRLRAFEGEYGITLPSCYRAFISEVGNGGASYRGSGAGPYYGIYPLGGDVDELVESPRRSLVGLPKVHPGLTPEEWEHLCCRVNQSDGLSDEEYEAELESLYAGLLPIGSQGCTYLHALVVAGQHRGRVVHMDSDRQRPVFAPEPNFLDWYERWLDDVISGTPVRWP